MKVTILYTRDTPADRDIEYLRGRLEDGHVPVEMVEADSREGIALTELYDALQRPAVLVTDNDGRVIQQWQGSLPPVMDVEAAYHSGS
jgi:hypothetical protein